MSASALAPDAWQRFLELLPWYVNGTLTTNDRHEMLRWLAASPECRAELYEVMSLARRIRNQPMPTDTQAGLGRLMAMVHANDSGKLLTLTSASRSALAPSPRPARWYKPALAIAATVALFQTGVVFLNMYETGQDGVLRPLGTTQTAIRQNLIQATFRTTASDLQIRALLALVGAEIISGPGALGVYTLKVPPERNAAAILELRRATAIVDSATSLNN